MAQRFEFRKGFLKFQRLGPVKFGEQSRWSVRAPRSEGMWAFPAPHFDPFFAYHRYRDLMPKDLRADYPKATKWWRRYPEAGEAPYEGFHEISSEVDASGRGKGSYPVSSMDEIRWIEDEDSYGGRYPQNGFVIPERYQAEEDWVRTVGMKILPLREFWYRGELYSHFMPDGSVGMVPLNSSTEGVEWNVIHTEELARQMQKPGGVVASGGHGDDGRPALYNFSKDHLEVFIARGMGEIRDRI